MISKYCTNRQLIYRSGKRERRLKIIVGLIGGFMIVLNYISHIYFKVLVGFILVIVSFYRKEIYINNGTIEFVHIGLFLKHIDVLKIADINDIVIKKQGEKTILCLINNYDLKKITLDSNSSDKIVKYILNKNDNLELN